MLHVLAANSMQLLHQALLVVVVAAVGRLVSRLIKISAEKPRTHRFKIDLGVVSVAVVITIGGTRQARKSLIDAKRERRDG